MRDASFGPWVRVFFFLSLFFNTNKYFILGLGPIEGTGG